MSSVTMQERDGNYESEQQMPVQEAVQHACEGRAVFVIVLRSRCSLPKCAHRALSL